MKPRAQIAMMSIAGREEITADTCQSLMGAGGLGELGIVPVLHFVSPPGRKLPDAPGWLIEARESDMKRVDDLATARRFRGKGGRSPWLDFAHVIASFDPSIDALFFEDDLIASKNAVRKMVELEVPADLGMVSFFDFRNEWPRPGLWRNPAGRDFWGAQALKIPARVLPLIQAAAVEPTALHCWDVWMGRAVEKLGLGVAHYSPSPVQHVGAYSMYVPGVDRPQAWNFAGEDHDAMGPCADPVPRVPPLAHRGVRCELHNEIHFGGMTCPFPL